MLGSPQEQAAASVRRAAMVARVSGISLVVLAGASLLVAAVNPLSAGFFISAAVVINGVVEWRQARRLAACDPRAPGRLALNQLLLGVEIAVYAAWQATHLEPESVQRLFARPLVRGLLGTVPPEVVESVMLRVPDMLKLLYLVVGVVAVLGCGATAIYYRRRRSALAVVRAAQPPPLP